MPPAATLPSGRVRRSSSRIDVVANARKAANRVKVGRPLTYDPELCQRAVALGMLGNSWAGIARDFGISRSTLNTWEGQYPEFKDALARARTAAQAWFEEHGRKNLKAKHYQAQVSRTIMAAQFEDYREQRSDAGQLGFDLGAFVGALASLAKPAATLPGDDAKAVEPLNVVTEKPKG